MQKNEVKRASLLIYYTKNKVVFYSFTPPPNFNYRLLIKAPAPGKHKLRVCVYIQCLTAVIARQTRERDHCE